MSSATLISFSPPADAVAGSTIDVPVVFQNSGSDTWIAATVPGPSAGFRLGSYPHDNIVWGFNRVLLPGNVAPGANVTIHIVATVPASLGATNFSWQMVDDTVAWFGDVANGSINITAAPPPPPTNLSEVLSPFRSDPSSGTVFVNPEDEVTPCLFYSGAYVADTVSHHRDYVNDTGSTLHITRSFLWTGIDVGGVCDTGVQLVRIAADGTHTLIHDVPWDHYAEPNAPVGEYLQHNPPVELLEGEIIRFNYSASAMGGKHAAHVGNIWVVQG